MRFTHEGRTYVIEFRRQYGIPVGQQGVGRKPIPRPYTTARLLEVTGDGPTERTLVRTYTVGCAHRDAPNNELGRKAALTAALYDAPTKGGGTPVLGAPLTKDFRTAVWLAYHSRSRGVTG